MLMKTNFLSRKQIELLLIALIASVCLFGLLVAVASLSLNCIPRQTQSPIVPTYPNSTLVYNEMTTNTSISGGYEAKYSTKSTREKILAFYADKAFCGDPTVSDTCKGKAYPFGTYYVLIDEETDITYFRIQVAWNKCAIDIDHPSVEN